MKKHRIWLLIPLLIVITGCSRIKRLSLRIWEKSIVIGLRVSTQKKPFTIGKYFQSKGQVISVNVKDLEGILIADPLFFFRIYLHYRADMNEILAAISSLPATPSGEIESYPCRLTREKPKPSNHDRDVIGSSADFYWSGLQRSNLVVFECMRFPDQHVVAYDPDTKEIYHTIGNVRE